jgi:hypothetical protein
MLEADLVPPMTARERLALEEDPESEYPMGSDELPRSEPLLDEQDRGSLFENNSGLFEENYSG